MATVTITVNAVNDAPVAGTTRYSVEGGDVLVVDAPGVLANDTDVEGNPLTATLLDKPSHGELESFKGRRLLHLHARSQISMAWIASSTPPTMERLTPRRPRCTITVTAVDPAPTVANPIPDQTATEDVAFSYTFPEDTFSVANAGDTLTYAATLAGGDPLPGLAGL